MRELNECTQEVFRRSEKRIRERKRNRSRALALCIPVCLIAALCSVMDLPAMIPAGETSDRSPMSGEAHQNSACPYIAVEVQNDGLFPAEHDGKVTDRWAVAEMFSVIHSLFADADGNGRDASEDFAVNENCPANANNTDGIQTESASTNRSKGCTITFTAEDGSRAVYHLSGNTLVDVNTNEAVFLSNAQAAELMAVLRLTE